MEPNRFPSVISLAERRAQQEQKKIDEPESGLFQGIPCEAPVCPAWLSDDAKKHWRYLVKYLKGYGLISRLDQGTLANLCTYYARAKESEEQLQERGEFQTTPNGYVQISPYSVAFARYSKLYNVLAKQFGLTPVARKGVSVDNPNQLGLGLDLD
ncbi:MAG TPA: phage terminase small subunit P27 family [Gammaproteobacteria bacterium]